MVWAYRTSPCLCFWHVQAVREILRRDGIRRGMFAGYGAFLLRDLPFDAIEFWAFDTLNIRLQQVVKRELNPVEHAVCGAIAGAVTGTFFLPSFPYFPAAFPLPSALLSTFLSTFLSSLGPHIFPRFPPPFFAPWRPGFLLLMVSMGVSIGTISSCMPPSIISRSLSAHGWVCEMP